jgi:4-hydroxythreonine-4-phosphate dehydrogenase
MAGWAEARTGTSLSAACVRVGRLYTRMHSKIRVAITMGDPSGVGPALIAKGLPQVHRDAEYIVIGDASVLKRVGPLPQHCIDMRNVPQEKFSFGLVRREYGRASIEYIDKALELIARGEAECLVTCPISKQAVHLAGFEFPGHTGYLAARAGVRHTVMLLMNKKLKTALVTQHLPLGCVAQHVTREAVCQTVSITAEHLRSVWGIDRPRIVVCALNPHASDNGLIGDEESRILAPAVRACAGLEADVSGPLAADTALACSAQGEYDCAVALYHDQALIPLKVLGGDSGVNVTAGLPYVRTSPLHGTAFDKAGNLPLVHEHSFVESVRVALECCRASRIR